jgi:hypothetical protein
MKKKFALIISVLALSSCKMQQDPIEGAPEAIRLGRPPSAPRPVQEKPLDKNALQIDAPSLVNGRVGSSVEFNIFGRVMTPNVGFQISIDNLSEFPGATFDANKGEFKWQPQKTTVGNLPSVELPLRVTLSTIPTKDAPTVSVERKTIVLVIGNNYSKPLINVVTGPSAIVTGGRHTFKFQLEDIDAAAASDVTIDVRTCDTNYNENSLSHLVTVKDVQLDSAGSHKFKGEAILDLVGADYVNSGSYCIGLIAVSKHGVVSDLYKKAFSVEAKMKATKMTMEYTPVITVGEKIQIGFSIYDATGVGRLNIRSMDSITLDFPGSTLVCNPNLSAKYQIDCAGLVDATTAKPNSYFYNIVVENLGTRAIQTTVTNHILKLQVKGATP